MKQYEMHLLTGGIWAGITENGKVLETIQPAYSCRSLKSAHLVCDRHAGRKLQWKFVDGHMISPIENEVKP